MEEGHEGSACMVGPWKILPGGTTGVLFNTVAIVESGLNSST
jgi:hypothetical protein